MVDRFGSRFGGAEAYGVALMKELAQRHDVTVIAREYDAAAEVHLPYVPMRFSAGLPSWLRVLLFARRAARATRSGFDIVHSHMNGYCGDVEVVHVTPVRYNWRCRPMPRVKRWLSYVSPRVQTYLRLEARRLAPRPAHRSVAVSGLIADQLRQAYGAQFDAPVIPPGVAPPAPREPGARREFRNSLGYADADCVCLLVARNPLRKGLPTVLRALQHLPERFKLLVVGATAGTRDFIFRNDAHRAISDRIRLIDATPDVGRYYTVADVYVHPTLNDSFGMAPLEAMSYGLPVILSPDPWCGFARYVQPDSDALVLSHPENDQELADNIRRIDDDAELRQTLAAGADALVRRHAWPKVADQYEALYRQVLQERRPSA